jgi:ferritin-like metal-binding protein YciE
METTTQKQTSTINKMYCNFFGHQYKMTKKVTHHVKEYTCKCCKKQLTTNANGKLTELTPTYQDINSVLERIYQVRVSRLKQTPQFSH